MVKAQTVLGRVDDGVSDFNLVPNDVDVCQSSASSCDSRSIATGWSCTSKYFDRMIHC
jgi:hypothetical protein